MPPKLLKISTRQGRGGYYNGYGHPSRYALPTLYATTESPEVQKTPLCHSACASGMQHSAFRARSAELRTKNSSVTQEPHRLPWPGAAPFSPLVGYLTSNIFFISLLLPFSSR